MAYWRLLGAVARENRRTLLFGWAVLLGVIVVLVPFDRLVLDSVQTTNPVVDDFARASGDFSKPHWVPLLASVLLGACGWFLGSRRLRHAAVVAMVACLVAGMTVNVFRAGLGRPRPSTDAPDGLYGPSLDHAYQSFPSGHSGASFGYSTALAVAVPALAVPAAIFAVQTGWARMQINRHRLSDVLAGAGIGVTWGLLLGTAVRRRLDPTLTVAAKPEGWSQLPSRARAPRLQDEPN